MERNQVEVVIEEEASTYLAQGIAELNDLQLASIGGGIADVIGV